MREVRGTILENKRLAEEIYSLTFAAEEMPVRPGQFCMIGAGELPLRRPLAVCKAEGERYTVCYRVRGAGTRMLAENYRAGESLSVLLPLGNGFYVAPEEKKIAVVGGGVGIFPLISAIRGFREGREIYAYMGFRSRAEICMEYEMQKANSLVIATDDGSRGFGGTAVQAFMADFQKVKPNVVLACGPTPMLRALKAAVGGKLPVYVSLEERMGCGIGACLVCVCETTKGEHARVCKDGPVFEIGNVVL